MTKIGEKLIEAMKEAADGKYGRVTIFLNKEEMVDFIDAIDFCEHPHIKERFIPINSMVFHHRENAFWRIAIGPVEDTPRS